MFYVLINREGGGSETPANLIYMASLIYYIYRGKEPSAALVYSLILLGININI